MTNCNVFLIGGNVSSDVRLSKNGKFGYFDVAVNRNKTGPAIYIPVRVFMNDYFKNNLKKGVPIFLQGRFESGSYKSKEDGTTKFYSFLNPVSAQHENNAWIGMSASVDVANVQGNLVTEPEMRQGNDGKSFVTFRLACNHYSSNAEKNSEASYLDVIAWDKTADFISKYFHKGSGIFLSGYLSSRTYKNNNGENRTAYSVVATSVEFASWKKKNDDSTAQAAAAPVAATPAPAAPTAPTYGEYGADEFDAVEEDDLPF